MARIASILLALFLLVQASALVAVERPSAQPPQPDSLTVSADLDGDNKPDLAVGKRSGSLGYTVEVRFSSRIPSAFLTVANAGAGINVIICDINRDNDQDVVIQGAASAIPLAIWLGDGKGHFRRSNPWQYIPLRMDHPTSVSTDQDSCTQASLLTETRFDTIAAPAAHSPTEPARQGPATGTLQFPASCRFDRRNPGRSPPSLS